MPLKLGYIGVVNRCQADIAGKVSMEKSEERGRGFLSIEGRVCGDYRPVWYEGVGEHRVSIIVRTRGEIVAGFTPKRVQETDKAACDVAEFGDAFLTRIPRKRAWF